MTPKVELEVLPCGMFRVRKVRLTEKSSLAAFADLHPHRDCGMPPMNPQMRQVVGEIDEANAEIYNERMTRKHGASRGMAPQINPGLVLVTEGDWDLRLTNLLAAGSVEATDPDPRCERHLPQL